MSVARAHVARREALSVRSPARPWRVAAAWTLAGGALAAVIAYIAGDPRPAMTPDSTAYLNAAANLMRGEGLVQSLTPLETLDRTLPLTTWPPLYPVLLAAVGSWTNDLVGAARLIQAVVVGLLALPVGLLAYRIAGRHAVWPVVAFAIVLRSQVMTASFVWSEPLFVLLSMGALALLLEALREERYAGATRAPLLFAAGVLAGSAMLTRYLGLIVIASGILTLVLNAEEGAPARKTTSQIATFSIPALLPNLALLARNRIETGFLFGEDRGASILEPQGVVLSTLRTLCTDTFLLPIADGGALRLILMALGLASIATLLGIALHRFGPESFLGPPDLRRIVNALVTFLCLYIVGTMALSLLVSFDAINTRLLSPVYPVLLLLGAFLLRPAFRRVDEEKDRRQGRGARLAIVTTLAVLWGLQAAAAARYVGAPRETRDLTHPYWRSDLFGDPRWASDPAVEGLLRLAGENDLVLTNVPEVVSLWTDRPVKPLPARADKIPSATIAQHAGAVVFVLPSYRRPLWGLEEMESLIVEGVCEPLGSIGEGVFYRVRG